MTRAGFGETAAATGADPARLLAEKAASNPLRRFGNAEHTGLTFAWIASDDSRFTTGASLNLTRGESVFF